MLCLVAGRLWPRYKMAGWALLAVLVLALCSGSVWARSEPYVTCEDTDESASHPVIRAAGEVWTARDCVRGECAAKYTPTGDYSKIIKTLCDPAPSSDCRVVSQNASAEYPSCCPRYECPVRCFSESLGRWFRSGDTWTEEGCVQARCSSTGNVSLSECGPLAVRPGCRPMPGDSEAEYPDCCAHGEVCDKQPLCFDEQLNWLFSFGEKWTLSGCGGQATCGEGGAVSTVGCPLQATDTPGCGLDDGDTSLEYPQCCPKITCKNCYSQRLNRYFGPGDTWTGGTCTANTCQAGPYGAQVQRRTCSPLGEPPYADCQLLDANPELGEFPQCCPVLRCPGRCQDGDRWYSVGQQWDSGCTRSVCIDTGRVERLTCLVQTPQSILSPRHDCYTVPGNSSAGFPACCSRRQCVGPMNECLDASRGLPAADGWTEPGDCSHVRCELAEGGVAVLRTTACPPPPPFADCRLVAVSVSQQWRSGNPFPYCCPIYRCPGRCYSDVKQRWFSVGERWMERECWESVCEDRDAVESDRQCPVLNANKPECSRVKLCVYENDQFTPDQFTHS